MRSLLFLTLLACCGSSAKADLVLTGIFDGSMSSPKGVELYVLQGGSFENWTLSIQSNASTNAFITGYTFDNTVYATGSFLYVTSTPTDATLIGLGGTIISDGSFDQNGDDRIRLADNNAVVIDQFGVTDVDGTGEAWEYLDSFATRFSGTSATGSFNLSDWDVRPPNSLDAGNGPLTAAGGLGSFSSVPEPSSLGILTAITFFAVAGLRRRTRHGQVSAEGVTAATTE